MEEPADVERAETERTGHFQYTETVRGESSGGTTLGDISLLDRSMYYWALTVSTPREQYVDCDASQPPIFSPLDASHVSMLAFFICPNKTLEC